MHVPVSTNVFYRAGIIERWGSGTLNIIDWCMEKGKPGPEWKEQAGSVFVTFLLAAPQVATPGEDKDRNQVGIKLALSRHQVDVLRKCRYNNGLYALMIAAGRADRIKFRNQILKPLLEAGLVKMTIPDKPRSSNIV